jgi:hypothetical protein
MTRHPYINSGASSTTEDLVMDVDTRLVHAGSTPNEQSDEEPERAELMTLDDYLDNDNRLVRAGSSPNDQSDEELDRADPMAMDHLGGDTRLVSAESSQTAQGDEELERAEPMAVDHVDNDTQFVSTGSSPTDQVDEEPDHARLRLELIASIFASNPVQLKDFEPPPECFQYRDQADDVFSTYCSHTIFYVKVWINFDAHEKVFFEGTRSADCGKLQLPEALYRNLAGAEPTHFGFHRVCFEICTPFRTLAVVDLNVEDSPDGATLQVGSEMAHGHDGKIRLDKYIQNCCVWMRRNGLAHGFAGLRFQDLEAFASLFCRDREVSPGRSADWEEPQYGGGEWAGVEDPYKVEWSTTGYNWR